MRQDVLRHLFELGEIKLTEYIRLMKREEQINRMAKEIATYLTSDKDVQVAFADVLKRGAQWADAHPDIDVRTMAAWQSGYKEAIERAREWLKEEYPKAAAYYEHPDSFIDDFKKAMKGD